MKSNNDEDPLTEIFEQDDFVAVEGMRGDVLPLHPDPDKPGIAPLIPVQEVWEMRGDLICASLIVRSRQSADQTMVIFLVGKGLILQSRKARAGRARA